MLCRTTSQGGTHGWFRRLQGRESRSPKAEDASREYTLRGRSNPPKQLDTLRQKREGEKEGEGRPCSKAIKRSPIQIRNSNKKERRRRKWKSRECGRSLAPAPKVGRSADGARTGRRGRGLCSRKKFAGLPRLISYPSSSSSSTAELMERSAMRASERRGGCIVETPVPE